ncbi:hypothetical protein QBC37DRAFT_421544 [Rhypophila decipiens]|uniref:Uncharacterized protein n=1 Tax=Rhypophila decipiens TaxID=261697 RepID=A0AAN6Y8S9_9PEZI|nr:hypothetical protein QBC37DRAFT_421544 [Rhypophila decipiens]
MEDEEYYHMMMDDLERLERVHHHREPDAEFLAWEARQQGQSHHQHHLSRRDSLTSPLLSGLRVAITGVVKAGIDAAKRRASVGSNHSH